MNRVIFILFVVVLIGCNGNAQKKELAEKYAKVVYVDKNKVMHFGKEDINMASGDWAWHVETVTPIRVAELNPGDYDRVCAKCMVWYTFDHNLKDNGKLELIFMDVVK